MITGPNFVLQASSCEKAKGGGGNLAEGGHDVEHEVSTGEGRPGMQSATGWVEECVHSLMGAVKRAVIPRSGTVR